MRIFTIGLTLVAVAMTGCSKAPDSESRDAADVSNAGPGVSVTAAPGVAFAYRYAFRLPSTEIARAQERHAQACERLGIARCRITGMRYRLLGENDVEAMLTFKLDPTIARAFGKTGIAAIEAAHGTLVDAEITGTDAGAEIDRLAAAQAETDARRRQIDADLAAKARSASERAEFQRQRDDVARQAAATRAATTDQRASLATTPMTFDYGSGPAIRGFDGSAPFTSALDLALGSLQTTLAVGLGLIAILAPPALALLLLWLAWRRMRPLWARRNDP